ncbi:peptidylprolyl isomerase [Sphingomonas endolithica]|uniref:peptidylprolyl isomerase n=1 Tax=Sphingomonas endolithica TaxID=2972485 RepID=UPI0021AF1A5F|nr:peptidylprolyl isomerase [Sphingomonas sp. ZFBP2030]
MIALLLALLAIQAAPAAQPAAPLPSDAVAGDWRAIPDDELLVMTLSGNRAVVIRLAARFAPAHVANIRTLARAHWWDAASVYRVQENWVAQWGDATERKPLPSGVVDVPPAEFEIGGFAPAQMLPRPDGYALRAGITADGWPIAGDGKAAWLTHCYGMVGVARDALPSTGSGAELFTPIGQSARRLDRNYTVVGRIIEGMQYLSAMPRSDAPLGMYATEAERTAIVSARLASDMPSGERPRFEYRAADTSRFAALIASKANPAPPTVPTGLTVCDVPLATRRVATRP